MKKITFGRLQDNDIVFDDKTVDDDIDVMTFVLL